MRDDEIPVLADFSAAGTSDQYGRIVIDTRDMTLQAGSRRASVIMVVYDSTTRMDMESGSYGITMQVPKEDTPWGPQSALVLATEDAAIREVVLRLAALPESPVQWRAVGVTLDGRFRSYPKALWHDTDILETPTLLDEIVTSIYAQPLTPTPGGTLPPEVPNLPTSPVTETTGFEYIADDRINQQMAGYWWQSDHTFVVQATNWWEVTINVAWTAPVAEAAPACCDCGDVFLIRDPTLALNWDQEGSSALIDSRTLVLNTIDPEGTKWILTDMTGWWTLPDVSLPSMNRAGYLDGFFPVDGRYEARGITIEGMFFPGPGVGVASPRGQILRTADAVREGALLVAKEPGFAKQSYVWLADTPDISTSKASGETEFSITLRAVDPVKYNAGSLGLTSIDLPMDLVLSGRVYLPDPEELRFVPVPVRRYQGEVVNTVVHVSNVGNTKVSPRIYIYGPVANPTVQNQTTGQTMTFQGSVNPEDVLIVDCYWRTVVLRRASELTPEEMNRPYEIPGDNRRYMLTLTSPWIDIVPGDNQMRATSGVEGGKCSVVFRSGWIGS